ncbi:MAG: hypothetical protein CMM01_26965 [Rhodopirellula sp.]|nr:hypothetical protein [Rhodopirellula sp.]
MVSPGSTAIGQMKAAAAQTATNKQPGAAMTLEVRLEIERACYACKGGACGLVISRKLLI